MVAAVSGLASAVVLLGTVLLGPPPASEGALALSWEAPAGCPESDAVRQQVVGRLGPAGVDRPFVASMVARAHDDGYRVTIAIDDAGVHSERGLAGATCDEVASAAALIVAMTIDPRIQAPPPNPPAAAEPPAAVPTPLKAVDEPPRAGALPDPAARPRPNQPDPEREPPTGASLGAPALRRARGQLRFAGDVGAGVGAGPLPRAPSAIVFVAAGLRGVAWRVQGTARWWSPRVGPSSSNEAVSVRAQLWDLGVAGCGIIKLGSTAELPLCGTLSGGLMHAQGRGRLRVARRESSPWAAFGLGAEFTWWFGARLGLGARVHGLVTLARTVFETEPSGVAHRAGSIGGVFGAHLGLRLP